MNYFTLLTTGFFFLLFRRLQKNDIGKLYEMDDNPERRIFLDKLLHFMEERGTPIPTCPSMCKTPLDLFRLYVLIKDRGGFMEVCKVQCSSMVTLVYFLLGLLSFLLQWKKMNQNPNTLVLCGLSFWNVRIYLFFFFLKYLFGSKPLTTDGFVLP